MIYYDYYFSVASIFFMALTAIFYFSQKRLRDLQDRLYTVMIIGGLFAVVFDTIAAAIEPFAESVPLWFIYLSNMAFLLGEHICLPAFFLYSIASSEQYEKLTKIKRFISYIPFITVAFFTAVSPFCKFGIFYIDENHRYCHGPTHILLYITAAVYMIAACVAFICNFRKLSRARAVVILSFSAMLLTALVFQMFYPQYLIASSALALSLTAMYYTLRAPGEQVDLLTGAFCRTMLPTLLSDRHSTKKPYSLVLVTISNINEIIHINGTVASDEVVVSLSEWLRTTFPKDLTVYMDTYEFTLIRDLPMDKEALAALKNRFPVTLNAGNRRIPVSFRISAIEHNPAQSPRQVISTISYLFRQMDSAHYADVTFADTMFQKECSRKIDLIASIDTALTQGGQKLLQRQICAYESEEPYCVDVSLEVAHELLIGINTEEFLTALRQTGHIWWYYEKIFALSGKEYGGVNENVRICIPLYYAILIQEDAAEKLVALTNAAGLTPQRVMFRMPEEELSECLQTSVENLEQLHSLGYTLRLDNFAAGYTNISLLTEMPVDAVMINAQLLRSSEKSERNAELLKSIVSILRGIGKEVIGDYDSFRNEMGKEI